MRKKKKTKEEGRSQGDLMKKKNERKLHQRQRGRWGESKEEGGGSIGEGEGERKLGEF